MGLERARDPRLATPLSDKPSPRCHGVGCDVGLHPAEMFVVAHDRIVKTALPDDSRMEGAKLANSSCDCALELPYQSGKGRLATHVVQVAKCDERVKMIWHHHEFIEENVVPEFRCPPLLFFHDHANIGQHHTVGPQRNKEWLAVGGANRDEIPPTFRVVECLEPGAFPIPEQVGANHGPMMGPMDLRIVTQ